MPFELKNVGVTYQRLVNKMFVRKIGWNVEVYVDDMLVKSKEEDHHPDDLRETFDTLCLYEMKLNPSKCVFGVSSRKFFGFMVSQWGVEANPNKIQAIPEISPLKNIKAVQSLNGKVAALNRFISRATKKCLSFKWTDECQKAYLASPSLLSPSKPDKELLLYLTISPTTISSTLIWEECNV